MVLKPKFSLPQSKLAQEDKTGEKSGLSDPSVGTSQEQQQKGLAELVDINDPEMSDDDADYKPPQQWGISTFKPPPVPTKSPPAKDFLGPSVCVESDWGYSMDLEPTPRGQKAFSARSGKSNHWGESDDDDDDIPTIYYLL